MFIRTIFILTTITLLFLTATTGHATALKWADGTWGWIGQGENQEGLEELSCGKDSLQIRLDSENKRYTAKRQDGVPILGDILSIRDGSIIIQYDDEERLMDDGKPHIWMMVFASRDKFIWVRKDWLKNERIVSGIGPFQRCLQSIV